MGISTTAVGWVIRQSAANAWNGLRERNDNGAEPPGDTVHGHIDNSLQSVIRQSVANTWSGLRERDDNAAEPLGYPWMMSSENGLTTDGKRMLAAIEKSGSLFLDPDIGTLRLEIQT